ncbi:MAG: cupin domain-containing protein [Proteobacteria bacterium]|nr:cupin domain-containing protein [Pseudomonadota bacterium]
MTGAPGTHRIVEKVTEMKLEPFNRYGDEVTKLFWNPITFDRATGKGCFIIRFLPGGVSQPHEHLGFEEFYVVEGPMVDHDGVAYEVGSFVSLGPNVRHYSHAPEGVLLVAWLSGNNRALEEGEEMSFGPDTIKTGRYLPPTGTAPKGPIGTHRIVEKVADLELTPFDRYGEDVPKLHWNPITFDRETGKGCFIIRFLPGGVSTPHEHFGMEEFYVIEGELIDHDGQKYSAGDFVSLGPNVRHYSYSPGGALTVAWLTDTNRTLTEGEELSFGPDVLHKARYRPKIAAE